MKSVRSDGILGKLTLVAISLGIALFLAEMLLRQVYPIDTGTPFQHRIPHPVFGWVLEPGASYLNHMPEATVRVTYNSKGWRDAEHSFENRHGVFRIIVLGDSFMEAYSVELNETFHKRIEQFSRDTGVEVEVINLGVGGYGTLQEYLVFREVGLLYKPNLVLLGFYIGNDLKNNHIELDSIASSTMQIQTRPFLDLADSARWKITVVDFEAAQSRYAAAKMRQNSFLGKFASQSALLQELNRARKGIVSRIQDSQIDQQRRYLALYGANYCQETPEYAKAQNITKRVLARLKHDTETIGSQLLVFTVPAVHEVDATAMKEVIEGAPESAKLCLEETPAYERSKNILKELKIEYVDLLPDFRNAMQDGVANLFWRSDRHWNPEGHALAAKIVGSFLVEKSLLTVARRAQQNAAPDRYSAVLGSGR